MRLTKILTNCTTLPQGNAIRLAFSILYNINVCIAWLDFDFAAVDALLLLSLRLGVYIAQLILQAVLKFHNHGQTTGIS